MPARIRGNILVNIGEDVLVNKLLMNHRWNILVNIHFKVLVIIQYKKHYPW